MEDEKIDYVAIVKKSFQEDLNRVKELTGEDYSCELGIYLSACLRIPQDLSNLMDLNSDQLGQLSTHIKDDHNIPFRFFEASKAIAAINLAWKSGDKETLSQLELYAAELQSNP